jgi:hypothetical protein
LPLPPFSAKGAADMEGNKLYLRVARSFKGKAQSREQLLLNTTLLKPKVQQ